jgi:NADH-quinone oxidoreductase subunit J
VGSVEFLAEKLFGPYLLPFEVASVLLLVGLVGAIALAKKRL